MANPTVTVEIPAGTHCTGVKLCIFARYTKKWNGYNCTVYNRILKGGNDPKKCAQCKLHCNAQKEA